MRGPKRGRLSRKQALHGRSFGWLFRRVNRAARRGKTAIFIRRDFNELKGEEHGPAFAALRSRDWFEEIAQLCSGDWSRGAGLCANELFFGLSYGESRPSETDLPERRMAQRSFCQTRHLFLRRKNGEQNSARFPKRRRIVFHWSAGSRGAFCTTASNTRQSNVDTHRRTR